MLYRCSRIIVIAFVMLTILPVVGMNSAVAAERYCVGGKIANIRAGAGTDNEILFQAEKYYPLKILRKKGNWYEIEDYEGDVGWIHKSLVSKIETVITTEPINNVRSGPSIKNPIVFKTERGVPFKVLKRKGNWINVEHADGHTGWIHNSIVW
jgi:SH3-like domain-containing protein